MGRLKLREMVITFEVLSFCRIQGRDHVCGEKGVGAVLWGNNVWLEEIEAEKDDGG